MLAHSPTGKVAKEGEQGAGRAARKKSEAATGRRASEAVFWGPFKGLRVTGGDVSYIYFSSFAIDRSKKYIKVIKNYIKNDAVDP